MRKKLKRNLIVWLSLLGMLLLVTFASIEFWLPQVVRSYISFQGFQVSRFDLDIGIGRITIHDMVISQKNNDLVFDLTLPEVHLNYGLFSGIKGLTVQNPRLVIQYCPIKQSKAIQKDLNIMRWFAIKRIDINNLYLSRMHCYPDLEISEFFINARIDQVEHQVSIDVQYFDWSMLFEMPLYRQALGNTIEWVSEGANLLLRKSGKEWLEVNLAKVSVKTDDDKFVEGDADISEFNLPNWSFSSHGHLYFQQDKPKALSWQLSLNDVKQSMLAAKHINLNGQFRYPRHHQQVMVKLVIEKPSFERLVLPAVQADFLLERTLEGVNFTANVNELLNVYLDMDFHDDQSKASIQVKAKTRSFAKLPAHLPYQKGDIHINNGRVDLFGTVHADWDNMIFMPNLKMRVEALSFNNEHWFVDKLQSDLHFQAGKAHSASPIKVERIKGPINIGKLLFDFEFQHPKLSIKKSHAKLAGGSIYLSPKVIDLSKDDVKIHLHMNKLQLTPLLKIFDWDEMKGKGKISGTIPITFLKEGIEIDKGNIQSDGPGQLQYHPSSDSAMAKQINDYSPVPLKVLSDYQYELLNIDIVHKGRDTRLMTRLSGRNPDFENGRLVDLNMNLNIQLADMLQSLWVTDEIETSLIKKYTDTPNDH